MNSTQLQMCVLSRNHDLIYQVDVLAGAYVGGLGG